MIQTALVSPENRVVRIATQISGAIPTTKPGWRWLPFSEAPLPDHDPSIQRLQAGDFSVEVDHVLKSWKTVPLTSEEQKHYAFNQGISAGFTVQPEGFTLRLEDADRAAFAQMLALVKEALELGMITSETPQLIADHAGTRHEVTTLRFRQIMVAYGLHYKSLWDALTA